MEYGEFFRLVPARRHRRQGPDPGPSVLATPHPASRRPRRHSQLRSVCKTRVIDRFIEEQIPFLRQYDTAIIANVSGNTVEEYEGMVEKISDADVDLIEMNISCPNVKCGGMAFGTRPDMVEEVVSAAKKKAKKPLIVKLSPQRHRHHRDRARRRSCGCRRALAHQYAARQMRINIETRKAHPVQHQWAGLSGPAVFRSRCAWFYQVRKAVSVPILGMGGIRTGKDIVEMLLAGADAIAMGTVMFADPMAPSRHCASWRNGWTRTA